MMSAKPHNHGSVPSRAGLSLARAQRLNDKAKARKKGNRSFVLMTAIASVGLLGAAGLYLNPPLLQAALVSETVAKTTPPAQAVQIDDAAAPKVVVAATTPVVAAQTPVAEPVVQPIPQTVAFVAPDANLAPCVQTIELQIDRLHKSVTGDQAWDKQLPRIRDLAQSVLDCDKATININGSFELAATDLADLRVRWDRADGVLDLSVVDSVAPGTYQAAFSPDGRPIDFLVQ